LIKQNRLQTKAFEEISKEIDITRFIKASRASRVMTKMFLKPNQSRLVKYFKRYTVDSEDEELPQESNADMST
jgi:hypothetical protein